VVVGQLRGSRLHGSGLCVRFRRGGVEDRIESGVVVHLELAVELEAAASGSDVIPELGKAAGKVVALLVEYSETLAVPFAMLGRGGRAVGLFGRVEDFERKDGEAIDHQAGSFRMQQEVGVERRERLEEIAIKALGEIVAELVELVNGAFAGGNGLIPGHGIAGGVFAMPEIEVGAMLVEDELVEVRGSDGTRRRGVVPEERGLIVQTDDLCGF
jgi:hypothetical protein